MSDHPPLTDLWVFAEHSNGVVPDATFEALGAARKLVDEARAGGRVVAVALGPGSTALAPKLAQHGAHVVRASDDERLGGYAPEAWAHVLTAEVQAAEPPPLALLFGAARNSQELAARVAARWGAAFVPDVVKVGWREGQLETQRLGYVDKVQLTLVGGRVLVLRPEVGDIRTVRGEPVVEPVSAALEGGDQCVRLVDVRKANPRTVPLSQADFIVAGGNGVKNFELIWEFADLVGAAVGGSRVVCDDGRLARSRQVGESGTVVSPRCYIAIGISGASQHVRGMQDSKLIITINNDRRAPIHDLASMAVIGDAAEILPALIERVKVEKEKAAAAPAEPSVTPPTRRERPEPVNPLAMLQKQQKKE